jgi:outer membrane protein assembly factor BamB
VSPEKKSQKAELKTLALLSIVLILALSYLFSAFPTWAKNGTGNTFWVQSFDDNIADYTVADEKVFAMTFHGYLQCFDQQSGALIWNQSLGGYTTWRYGELIKVAYGKVYAAQPRESTLVCFDENNGTVLWQFQPPISSSIASKSPPTFWVSEGKVLTTGDGFYMLDATNGTLLWDSQSQPDVGFGVLTFVDNQVLTGSVVSVDADSGQVQWSTQIEGPLSVVVGDGRIILWNLYQNQTMFCLDQVSGDLLWRHDVEGQVYQPSLSNGMVFFGDVQAHLFTKEYLFAIDGTNGQTTWSSELGAQNFTFDPIALHTQMIVRAVGEKVYTGYTVSESGNDQNVYEGAIYAFDRNGNIKWTTSISNFASAEGGGLSSITPTDEALYVIAAHDMHHLNLENGTVDWKYTFTYWVLPPIYAYNKLFLAADLRIIAFDPAAPPSLSAQPPPFYETPIGIAIIVTTVILVAASVTAIFFVRRKRRPRQTEAKTDAF